MNNEYYQNPILFQDEKNEIDKTLKDNKRDYIRKNYDIDIKHILELNRGKMIEIYLKSNQNNILKGILENSSIDNIIISSPRDGKWSVVYTDRIDFIVFDEEIIFYS